MISSIVSLFSSGAVFWHVDLNHNLLNRIKLHLGYFDSIQALFDSYQSS
jgi:hypothetical protein